MTTHSPWTQETLLAHCLVPTIIAIRDVGYTLVTSSGGHSLPVGYNLLLVELYPWTLVSTLIWLRLSQKGVWYFLIPTKILVVVLILIKNAANSQIIDAILFDMCLALIKVDGVHLITVIRCVITLFIASHLFVTGYLSVVSALLPRVLV